MICPTLEFIIESTFFMYELCAFRLPERGLTGRAVDTTGGSRRDRQANSAKRFLGIIPLFIDFRDMIIRPFGVYTGELGCLSAVRNLLF